MAETKSSKETKVPGHGMSSLRQQNLKAWQPVLTPVPVIGMLLLVFVLFLPIGIVLEDASNSVVEQSFRYDNIKGCIVKEDEDPADLPKSCDITFTLEHDMKAPIYFYYELKNFYQNHRRFLASKSDAQLRGDGNTADIGDCDPITKRNSKSIVPCGLSSGSYFEDRFSMEVDGLELCNTTVFGSGCYAYNNSLDWATYWSNYHQHGSWQKEGIAWDSDVDEKFKYNALKTSSETNVGPRQNESGLVLPKANDEDFIVWMRTAALPDFRKLHRIIKDKDLTEGDEITVTVHQWFPVDQFDGEKWIVLAKTEWCGSANHSLAWTYIVVACVAIALTVTFAILLLFGQRTMGEGDFTWHNRPNS